MAITKREFELAPRLIRVTNHFDSNKENPAPVEVTFDEFTSSDRELVWEFKVPQRPYYTFFVRIHHGGSRFNITLSSLRVGAFSDEKVIADLSAYAQSDDDRREFFTTDNILDVILNLCGHMRFVS